MFLKSISALVITIIVLFSNETFAGKRFKQEQNSTKVTTPRLKRTHKVDPSKTERNLNTPNRKTKQPDYKRTRHKNSFIPNRQKDKNVSPKKVIIDCKRSKTNKKKKTKCSSRSIRHQRQKDKNVALKGNVVAHKRVRADQKKNAKTSSRPVNPNKLSTNDSSNFDNHVWCMKDLGNGYVELTHRVDREMIIFGKRVSTKVPGMPTVFTLPKLQADAELKRQQAEARKEPRSAPVLIKKKRRSLRDIFSSL